MQRKRRAARLGALLELHVVLHRRELRVAEEALGHALGEAVLHALRLRVGGEAEGQPERRLERERGHLELARLG